MRSRPAGPTRPTRISSCWSLLDFASRMLQAGYGFATVRRGSILDRRRRAGQDIPQVEPGCIFVSVLGRAGCDRPGITEEVGILRHPLQRAVSAVAPKSVRPPEGDFLDASVLAV